jgi:hypothetical protein
MATAVRREQWNHTSSLAAMMINTAPFSKRRKPISPLSLHPFYAGRKRKLTAEESRAILNMGFGTGKKKKNGRN